MLRLLLLLDYRVCITLLYTYCIDTIINNSPAGVVACVFGVVLGRWRWFGCGARCKWRTLKVYVFQFHVLISTRPSIQTSSSYSWKWWQIIFGYTISIEPSPESVMINDTDDKYLSATVWWRCFWVCDSWKFKTSLGTHARVDWYRNVSRLRRAMSVIRLKLNPDNIQIKIINNFIADDFWT